MAMIVPLTRRVPMIRGKRVAPPESESREAARSMRVLLWTFALTALAMCTAVVVCFAGDWSQMLWISLFLGVFALCKIALANALFYVMVNYDTARATGPANPPEPVNPARPPRPVRRVRRTGMLRGARGSGQAARPNSR